MKRPPIIGAAVFLLGGVAGCGSAGPEDTYKEILSVQKQVTAALEEIKDEASAEAALPKLEKLTTRYADLTRQLKGFNLSADASEKLIDKYESQAAAAVRELSRAATVAKTRAPRHAERIVALLGKLGIAQTTIPEGN